MSPPPFGWLAILRVGLVQTALGAILVLTTSTLNRVMVVDYALPAALPGLLVALHHAIQMLRPRWGYASDRGGRRTPWIVGGMGVLALGGLVAALATAWMGSDVAAGTALAVVGFTLIGVGVGAAGTNLLVLLAERVDDERRAPAATIVWVMMIVGFILTAAIGGRLLDPYSPERLVAVAAGVGAISVIVTLLAVAGLEPPRPAAAPTARRRAGREDAAAGGYAARLRAVWQDETARRFTVFIFVSMLAYSAQDLILEPFAGLLLGLTPGETTRLGGVQNGGVLVGMIAAGVLGRVSGGSARLLRALVLAGCVGSAAALVGLASVTPGGPPIEVAVAALGLANGLFAVSAIGAMMALAGTGPKDSRGTRMGLWGAAQAIAFGAGGLVGTVAADLVAWSSGGGAVEAYRVVFLTEAVVFLIAAGIALRAVGPRRSDAGRLVPGE